MEFFSALRRVGPSESAAAFAVLVLAVLGQTMIQSVASPLITVFCKGLIENGVGVKMGSE